jgi:ribosomal protein L29
MKTIDLRKKTEQEIKELLTKTKKEMEEYRMKAMDGKEKNLRKSLEMRKDIARLQTVLTEVNYSKEEK